MPVALATAAWNLPRLAIGYAHDGVCSLDRKFHDCGHGMTGKGGTTPHPLPTLCNIRKRKITTVVTVALKHTGDIKITSAKIAQRIKIAD